MTTKRHPRDVLVDALYYSYLMDRMTVEEILSTLTFLGLWMHKDDFEEAFLNWRQVNSFEE